MRNRPVCPILRQACVAAGPEAHRRHPVVDSASGAAKPANRGNACAGPVRRTASIEAPGADMQQSIPDASRPVSGPDVACGREESDRATVERAMRKLKLAIVFVAATLGGLSSALAHLERSGCAIGDRYCRDPDITTTLVPLPSSVQFSTTAPPQTTYASYKVRITHYADRDELLKPVVFTATTAVAAGAATAATRARTFLDSAARSGAPPS